MGICREASGWRMGMCRQASEEKEEEGGGGRFSLGPEWTAPTAPRASLIHADNAQRAWHARQRVSSWSGARLASPTKKKRGARPSRPRGPLGRNALRS
eukprot:3082164-Pyramimonas_sp.AAC.1